MAELELIGDPDDAGSLICRIACFEKSVRHRFYPCKPNSSDALRNSPCGALPALRHGKVRLFEVRGITSYVDNRFNGRALMPADPIRRAEAEQWLYFVLSRLTTLMHRRTASTGWQCEHTRACLAVVNEAIGTRLWLVGRGFTLADIALLPAVDNLCAHVDLSHVLRQFPSLGVWFDKHKTRRSWLAASSAATAG